jgi:phosphatidate cytidylyltransferase
MNEFATRMLTITIGAIFGIFMVSYNLLTKIFFFGSILCLSYFEFAQGMRSEKLSAIDSTMLFVLCLVNTFGMSLFLIYGYEIMNSAIAMYICHLVIIWIASKTVDKVLSYAFIAFIWFAPSMFICIIYANNDPMLIIWIITVVWFTDGGAYMFGKLFGKTKLMQSISPNKTVEGTVLGITLSILVSIAISRFYDRISGNDWAVIAIIGGIIGQIGDLCESALKRWLKIKDSGTIMVGHGGILDRFDSIYMAVPVIHVFLYYRGYI